MFWVFIEGKYGFKKSIKTLMSPSYCAHPLSLSQTEGGPHTG